MRNKYGRAMRPPIGPWPGIEASDETWETVSVDEPELLPPIGERVEVIWVVANTEYNTMRLSYGHAKMVGDRVWENDEGSQVVFNPSFWRSER